MSKKFIDIDEVFKSKNPKLYKVFPKFIVSYIKRIVHQNQMNDFIDRNGHLHGIEFVNAIITEFGIKVKVNGIENLPASGGCILAGNHPLGGLDAIALMQQVAKKRTDFRFIVNDILLQIKNLERLFIGVNKHGKNSKEMLEQIDELYAGTGIVMIFPAGLVSRKQQGVIKDLEWKKSFITKSKKYQRNIIPVRISGQNTNWFYNLSNFRKKIGIKANIEMIYLPDEMYKQNNQTVEITLGMPIPWQTFDEQMSEQAWAQQVKEYIYRMDSSSEFNTIDAK
jgi:putative hemolysin